MVDPNTYRLFGITSEKIVGSENIIHEPFFFFEDEGTVKWVQNRRKYKDEWPEEALMDMRAGEEHFLYIFNKAEKSYIQSGQRLLVAGGQLVETINVLSLKGLVSPYFSSWKQLSNGYFLEPLYAKEANTLYKSMSEELWNVVLDYLKSNKEITEEQNNAFLAYRGLSFQADIPKREEMLREGAFYLATGNDTALRRRGFFAYFDAPEFYEDDKGAAYLKDVEKRLTEYRS